MASDNDQFIILENNNGKTSNGWSWSGMRVDGLDLTGASAVLKEEFTPRANQRLTIPDTTVDCTVVVTSNGQSFPDLGNPNDGMIELDFPMYKLQKV